MAITVTPVAISSLATADLPLTGTEIVPLVQDGTTKSIPVANLVSSWAAVATAALAAGDNNNLATDISEVSRLAVTLAGDANLTGLAGGLDGKALMIQNRDAVDTLTIPNESASSSAANRFAINGDLIVPPLCGALFIYDGVIQRWVKT